MDKTNEKFEPSPEVLVLVPETTGNSINGLGEAGHRRPTPIMWHDPEIIAHGEIQKYHSRNNRADGANEHRLSNLAFTNKPLPELNTERPDWCVEEWTSQIKGAALELEADVVGITKIKPEWIFEGYDAPYEWAIVLGVAMDYEELKTAPSDISQTEVQNQYARGTRAAYKLAAWMREHGWDGLPHGGPTAGPILMLPAAIDAGLGELGKHGSIINQQYGSSFRLASVLTNLPLVSDSKDDFGSEDFCLNCQICTNVCPVDAISPEKQLVRGDEKWYVDFDKCILYFVENRGCGLCIAQCPWSRTDMAPKLSKKMMKRRQARRS